MRNKIGHVLRGQVERGHSGCGTAYAKERGELGSVARGDLGLDVGTAFAAGGVGAVAASATGFVFAAAGVGLGGGEGDGGE